MDEIKKTSDEAWKETAQNEKEALKKERKFIPPEPDFRFFVTTLALQTAIALGSVDNPATQKKEEDLTQANFLIDTLGMLKAKTNGNLDKEEAEFLDNILYELRLQYADKVKGGAK